MKGKKQIIMDTALDLFAEHGMSQTTVQMVLDGSGISKGTFYKYFDSKDDIMKCLLEKHQQDEYILRQEIAEGQYDTEFDRLVDQLVIPMTMPSRTRLSGIFWSSLNTSDAGLMDFISVQIKWIAGRFVDVFGEGKRPYATEAALLYVGMVHQVSILWTKLYRTKADWKTAVPRILRYIEAILTVMEEAGEGILNFHEIGIGSFPDDGIEVNLEKLLGMLESLLETARDAKVQEDAIQYAEGLQMLLSEKKLNKHMIDLTLPAFRRAFKGTGAEREAHFIFVFTRLYLSSGHNG